MAERRKFKHFTWADRLQLEAYIKAGKKPREIAEFLHKDVSSIYIELKRGRYEHLNSDYTTEMRYSPDIAEKKYREHLAAKGAELKIGKDFKLAQYIEKKITVDKYSPEAVLGEIKVKGICFNTTICMKTLYNYIDKGVFLKLTNKNLPIKSNKTKRTYRRIKAKRKSAGISIEMRPKEILDRKEFGHWEMDCVEGAKRTKKTLLVLSERKTRNEIVIPIKSKTAACVVSALNALEKSYKRLFPKVFKTITVDNGVEFSDTVGIEASIFGGQRTSVYYCHPYSSWERGTNENINRMVRRHYPKGTNFERYPNKELCKLNEWINEYPRKIFHFHSSQEMFDKELLDIL